MKAQTLTMQAFGCYLEETTLELSLLADRLFLITGATGCGKTTLLDAICFALYCRATGGRRAWADMRSISAKTETPTFVDYSFRLGEERYRFRRTLRMHKVRGSDRIEARDEHECWRWKSDAWELMASGAESRVRECAQNVLGLTCEQFSQVIVLPQGEFRKLLLSNSSEKARIFQTLFQTERFDRVARIAQREAEGRKKELDALFQAQSALFAREGVENFPQLLDKLSHCAREQERAGEEAALLEAAMQIAGEGYAAARQMEKRLERREELRKKQEELRAAEQAMQAKRLRLEEGRRANRCYPYWEQAQKTGLLLGEKQRGLSAAERGEETARRLEVEVEELAALPDPVERESRMGERFPSVKAVAETGSRLEARLAQAQTDFQKAERNVAAGEGYLEEIRREAEKLPLWSEEAAALLAAREAHALLAKREEEARRAREAAQTAAGHSGTAKVAADALQRQVEQAEARLRGDMAASLAHTLRPGLPCPVCGSRTHPVPAFHGGEAPGREEIEALRRAAEQAVKQAADFREALSAREAVWQGKKELLGEQEAVCKACALSREQVERHLPAAQKKLQEARRRQEKLPAAQQLLEQRKKEREEARTVQEECRLRLKALTAELRAAVEQARLQTRQKRELAAAAAKAARREAGEAGVRLEEARRRLEEACRQAGFPVDADLSGLCLTEGELQRLEQELSAYEADWKLTGQELMQLEAALAGVEETNLQEKKATYEEAVRQSSEASQKQGSLLEQRRALQAEVKACEKQEAKGSALRAQYSACARLSKLLSGDNRSKVPLRMFVLGIMLDDILGRANLYFSTLSNGRYSLARPQESSGGRGYNGLELLVYDGHCGGTRNVDTLSGGELFLASLSLAFGLSDVVQGYSGGVRLDSLFIDEGFGTLDQETLDTAMKALESIQRSGRTVGIISHVSELKTRIGVQIVVSANKNGGSTARIEQ